MAQLEAVGVPEQMLRNFTGQVAPIFDQIGNLSLQIQNLRRTRDLLLPRLLSGQLELDAA